MMRLPGPAQSLLFSIFKCSGSTWLHSPIPSTAAATVTIIIASDLNLTIGSPIGSAKAAAAACRAGAAGEWFTGTTVPVESGR